ncbi:MAG: HEAT repeat domain-containing protein [Elusimicrobia bacterium]|nr:HEAT repeat domain-containing protein [Elusimicrobiota bacterium]
MKFFLLALAMCVAGIIAWRQLRPGPPPPPPAPPPAIMLDPAPVINEEEQAKIIRAANDQDSAVRWESILFLDKLKAPRAFEVMIDKLHKDSDPDLRIKIIELLGQRGSPKTTVPLTADPFNPTAVTVVSPADEHARAITENLIWASRDALPEIRLAALQALDTLGDYSVAPAIMDSLRDQDERVRLQALKTLNSLQDKKAAAIEAERSRQEELRQAEAAKRK